VTTTIRPATAAAALIFFFSSSSPFTSLVALNSFES
jgi:hypothetical protein